MDLTVYFQEYDRRTSSKLKNYYLAYIKYEYDKNPYQEPEILVNRFLNEIEIPIDVYQITLIPSFNVILDLYNLTQSIWNNDLRHFPKPDIQIQEKLPCSSLKMKNYAKFLLQSSGFQINIETMSYNEIKSIIDILKSNHEVLS